MFDCASKSHGHSLNDYLMKGPNLINSLVGVLLRFHKHPVAVVSIMFHQVRVAPRDRDALRFLWWAKGDLEAEPKVYHMLVHLFGAKSFLSCTAFCLKEVANEFRKYFEPIISKNVRQCFYVDDFLSGSKNCEAGIKLVEDMQAILAKAGFNLMKWRSTSARVMASVPASHRGKGVCEMPLGGEGENVVLGIKWSLEKDEFYFTAEIPDKLLTKRVLLSITNSLYDPLGFLVLVVLEAHMIYRSACQEQRDWDEQLSEKTKRRWMRWCDSLGQLKELRIPHWCRVEGLHLGLQLHFFSDASSYAKGCVCYVRITCEDERVECHLVLVKALLADEEKRTIPQLELDAALDAVLMARVVKRELGMEDCMCIFWTDSSAVLLSLQADRKQFPVYFKNRLARIQEYTSIHD